MVTITNCLVVGLVRVRVRVWIRFRFSFWLVSGYAHVFLLFSVVIFVPQMRVTAFRTPPLFALSTPSAAD